MSTPLSFSQGLKAVRACLRARRVPYLLGPPGIGKTALVRAAAASLSLPCHELIGSTLDPTDVAGLPWVDRPTGEPAVLRRQLTPEISACVTKPGVLFLDELPSCPQSTQAPLMRLMLDRRIGDIALHEASAIAAAGNPPDQCPSGVELAATTINRVDVLHVLPTLDELREFFVELGDPEGDDVQKGLRELGQDFSAVLAMQTDLVVFDPPRDAIEAGASWASPRAWETGLRTLAAGLADGEVPKAVAFALLSGAVGAHQATAYLAVRDLQTKLPSVDDICKNPMTAQVPAERDRQIAALGLVGRVADRDHFAAWAYIGRLPAREIATVCARILLAKATKGGLDLSTSKSPHAAVGRAARIELMVHIDGRLRGPSPGAGVRP